MQALREGPVGRFLALSDSARVADLLPWLLPLGAPPLSDCSALGSTEVRVLWRLGLEKLHPPFESSDWVQESTVK